MAQTDYTKIAFLSFDWDYEILSDEHPDIDEAIRRADDKMYVIKRKRHRD